MAISVVDCIGDACSTLNYSTIAHLRHNPRIQHTQNGQRLPVSRNEHANTSHHTVGHWADEDSWWCAYQFWLANNKQFLQLYCHFRNWKSPCICDKRQQLMCSFGDFYSFVTRSFRIFERNRNETMSIARKISFDWGQIEGRLIALAERLPPTSACLQLMGNTFICVASNDAYAVHRRRHVCGRRILSIEFTWNHIFRSINRRCVGHINNKSNYTSVIAVLKTDNLNANVNLTCPLST